MAKHKNITQYSDRIDWLRKNKKFSNYFLNEKFISNIDIIIKHINTYTGVLSSSECRYLELLCDFCCIYDNEDIFNKILEYKSTVSQKRKVYIRYGETGLHEYELKLKTRKRNTPNTWTMLSYWTKKGLTEKQAKLKIKQLMRDRSFKGHLTKLKNRTYRVISPLSIGYWTNKGYSLQEAETLRLPYLKKVENSLERYVNMYGVEDGTALFNKCISKRKNTIINRYGSFAFTGHTSKESLAVLIKLYKKLRKNNFKKDDIVWGISNRKEFVLTDFEKNKSYFYDFVIKSKKIIVEYNNHFWHPREGVKWNGFLDYDIVFENDNSKKKLAISRGYRIYYIWDTDNIAEKINYLTMEILNG